MTSARRTALRRTFSTTSGTGSTAPTSSTRLLDGPDPESKDPANTRPCHEEIGCNEDFFDRTLAAVPVRGLPRQSRSR